ncbi:hypothetical protein PO909_008947, partial [Leuciscus waleckii]
VTEVSYFRVTHSVRCSARLQISGWRVSPSLRRSTHSKADVTESCLYCLYPLSCLLGDTKHCLIVAESRRWWCWCPGGGIPFLRAVLSTPFSLLCSLLFLCLCVFTW